MRMDSENDGARTTTDNSSGGGNDASEPRESEPSSKLRDLKPEKDPMGAGSKTPPRTLSPN